MKKRRKSKFKKGRDEELEQEEEQEPAGPDPYANLPYQDSERTRGALIKWLVVLCFIAVGMMVYSIHYIRFVSRPAQVVVLTEEEQAAATAAEAARPAAERSVGPIWFSRSDGTYLEGDGSQPAQPALPLPSEPSAETPAEQPAIPGAETLPAAGTETTETTPDIGGITPEAPPSPA